MGGIEVPFQVQVEYDKSDFLAFSKLHYKTKARTKWIILLICAAVLCFLEILMLILSFQFIQKDTMLILLMTLIPLLIAEILFMPRLGAGVMAKTNKKLGICTMSFGEDEASVQSSSMRSVYLYDAFDSLYHAGDAFYLYLNRQQAIIIPERCFVEGDPAAFGDFISEKTGLELKEIK